MLREWNIHNKMVEEIDAACEGICEWGVAPIYKLKEQGSIQRESGVKFMISIDETLDITSIILSVMFKGIDNHELLTILDMRNVYCSDGNACSSMNANQAVCY